MSAQPFAAVLDLDGTLVDSVYLHVVTWRQALRAAGYDVPAWRIHAGIGMGSERLVPWLLGRHVDDADALAEDHTRRFLDRADSLVATNGALALLDDLERRDVDYRVATSASEEERRALLTALGRDDVPHVDSDAVASSKPAPDLLVAALEALGVAATDAVMVGDSPWDAEAARRIGAAAIGVRCGGFSDAALRGAGCRDVVDDPAALIGRL